MTGLSHLVGREPARLGVDGELVVGGDDGVDNLTGRRGAVVVVDGPHLDHGSGCNSNKSVIVFVQSGKKSP